MVPHGFRFNPTDEELIQILDRKASGQEMPLNFIIHSNIYDNEPQNLEWQQNPSLGSDERYYYCKRENDSREVAGKGWWKATSHVKKVQVNEVLVGHKRPLTFHKYRDNDRNRSKAIKTNWIMHEYNLESRLTDWRLCKIKYKGKPSIQEEMENIRQQIESSGSSTNTQLGCEKDTEQQEQENSPSLPTESEGNPTMPNYWNLHHLPQTPYYQNWESTAYSFDDQQELSSGSSNIDLQGASLWSWQN